MAVSQEQLLQIIQHNSTTLCTPKGQKKLNEMAGAIDVNSPSSLDVNPNDVSDEWDNFSLSGPMTPSQKRNVVPQASSNRAATSKIPNNIKESILNNPIDVTALSEGLGDTSFLDNVAPQSRRMQFNQQKLNEIKQQEQQYIPQQSFIDYNYLKHIISECISEYFTKQPLNEQTTLKQIGLSEGKIKLVDNSGNVFAANLEFKGNLNDRKKN